MTTIFGDLKDENAVDESFRDDELKAFGLDEFEPDAFDLSDTV